MFFFFQAEDGIRDIGVTGVQTCALPISAYLAGRAAVLRGDVPAALERLAGSEDAAAGFTRARLLAAAGRTGEVAALQIGRASCRERVSMSARGADMESDSTKVH